MHYQFPLSHNFVYENSTTRKVGILINCILLAVAPAITAFETLFVGDGKASETRYVVHVDGSDINAESYIVYFKFHSAAHNSRPRLRVVCAPAFLFPFHHLITLPTAFLLPYFSSFPVSHTTWRVESFALCSLSRTPVA